MGDTYPKYNAAVVQSPPVWLDREATTEKACQLIAEAGKQGAKLIGFPEVYIPGYPWFIWAGTVFWWNQYHQIYFDNGVEIPSPTTDRLCQAARDADIYVVMGMSEREGGSMYCTQLFIDSDGNIMGKHRKLKPTHGERAIWGQGDGSDLRVFDTPLGKLGGLNCWEHFQPLEKYAMYSMGEQVHVASWPAMRNYTKHVHSHGIEANLAVTRSYALEGACFVLCATSPFDNQVLDITYEGHPDVVNLQEPGGGFSQIIDPHGESIGGPPEETADAIVYAEIDLKKCWEAKRATDCMGHYSRPDVFSLHINRAPQRHVVNIGEEAAREATAVQVEEGRRRRDEMAPKVLDDEVADA